VNTPRFLTIAALLFAAGCSVMPGNQINAGITEADVEVCQANDGKPYVCKAHIVDGKEKQSVTLSVKFPDGPEVGYAAGGVRAFEAHRIRGAVERAVAAQLGEAAPAVVDAITKAVLGAAGP